MAYKTVEYERAGAAAIERLRDPVARVSSHYVVEEDGAVFRLLLPK